MLASLSFVALATLSPPVPEPPQTIPTTFRLEQERTAEEPYRLPMLVAPPVDRCEISSDWQVRLPGKKCGFKSRKESPGGFRITFVRSF